MKRSETHILTTHVGSLPRSEAMIAMLDRREAGDPPPVEEFNRMAHAEVEAVVRRQLDAGVDVVSDGETSKMSYATYVEDRLTGFADGSTTPKIHLDLAPHPDLRRKLALVNGTQRFRRPACVGPIAVKDTAALQADIANLKDAAKAAKAPEAFMNAASPGVIAGFLPNEYYKTHEEYVEAAANAMATEYETIADAGLLVQVDCPDLAMCRHTSFQDLTDDEFVKRAGLHAEMLNHALRNVPKEQVRVHICWGNYEGPHTHDIDLPKILGVLLGVKAGAFQFESANPRHGHDWATWRDAKLPDDLILIPGVIDTSTNFVEHPELVAQRIGQFAAIVGRERVIGGTDCGFGTSAGYGKLDPAVAYLKLKTLAEGAAIASRRLWNQASPHIS